MGGVIRTQFKVKGPLSAVLQENAQTQILLASLTFVELGGGVDDALV